MLNSRFGGTVGLKWSFFASFLCPPTPHFSNPFMLNLYYLSCPSNPLTYGPCSFMSTLPLLSCPVELHAILCGTIQEPIVLHLFHVPIPSSPPSSMNILHAPSFFTNPIEGEIRIAHLKENKHLEWISIILR